jgi:hypothetical protein
MPSDYNDLLKAILPPAVEIQALQAQMRALGLFAHDRELLNCSRCGLLEDVAMGGKLITCRPTVFGSDTGLRFMEIIKGAWRCPSCAATVHEPLAPEDQEDGLSS